MRKREKKIDIEFLFYSTTTTKIGNLISQAQLNCHPTTIALF